MYTTLDFRPDLGKYHLCGLDLPPDYDPAQDLLLCFVPDRKWKRP